MHQLDHICDLLHRLIERMDGAVQAFEPHLRTIPPSRRTSAENLLHYLALRNEDLTELQESLSAYGLSSLGRCEGAVYAHCQRVLESARCLKGKHAPLQERQSLLSNTRLENISNTMFGPGPSRIMVTLDPHTTDPERLATLLKSGMRIARINAGHGDPETWNRMITQVREASRKSDILCYVLIDLPGPKIRIGNLPDLPGIYITKIPQNRTGEHFGYGKTQLSLHGGPGLPIVGIDEFALAQADSFRFRDARGRRRECDIVYENSNWFVEHDFHLRILDGTPINIRRKSKRIGDGRVFGLPPEPMRISVQDGDHLVLVSKQTTDAGKRAGKNGPWQIPCTWDDIFTSVRIGQDISFDDGRCSGTIISQGNNSLTIEMTEVPNGIAYLRSDQGINLPGTTLTPPDILDDDRAIIEAFADEVDLIGCSFVQRPEQIAAIRAALGERAQHIGLIAKIETLSGCQRLADILMEGLRGSQFAVMVARGDLAVEIGFARMAEAQEEILWLCEAAHIPVVWGTQVLEKLAKKGIPTRAEVTDAAMSSRAECVMLNKGPHVDVAIRFLHEVVPRIRDQLTKKRALLRPLPLMLSGIAALASEAD